MNNTPTPNVTSIEQLKEYASGQIIELPPFAEGQQFFARLKRPSMLNLVKMKRIPNELILSANTLFNDGTAHLDSDNEDLLDGLFGVMDIICEAAFVEPTYQQIKEAGIELTDEQLLFVYGYSQNGVKQLNSFR